MTRKKLHPPGYCDAEWLDYATGIWHPCAIVTALRLMEAVTDYHQADSFVVKDEDGRYFKIEASELRLLAKNKTERREQ